MNTLLIRLFVKDCKNAAHPAVRLRYGKLAGGVGIASNLLLFVAKLLIGMLSGSISIMADAFNNLSDCASSVITLVGFKLSGKPADEHHPYGHARYEYIAGLIVSLLIIVIGVQFFISSLEKILSPAPVEFSWAMVVVLSLSVLIKLWQGFFNREIGRRIDSASLMATAADSRNDVITTGAVLLGTLIAHYSGLILDGWMGLAVSVFILVSGVGLVGEILSPLLGSAPDPQLVERLKQCILGAPSVLGIHDLVIHNYGAGHCFASAHVEMPAGQDIMTSHDIIDDLERSVDRELGVRLVIHMDPVITDDETLNALRRHVEEAAAAIDAALCVHDLRVARYKSHTNLIFEVAVPPLFSMDDNALRELLHQKVSEHEGHYHCIITVDRSYTSTTGYTGVTRKYAP